MSAFTRALAASASCLVLCSPAFADDAASVPPIVVSAMRNPTPITRIASSVTVITAGDIEREHQPTVIDLLRQQPGLAVGQNGGLGQTASVFLRGTNSNHVLVIIDGVRMNDPSTNADAFDFSNLSTDNIERIEILRGPQSVLYGPDAIGGVINIVTKTGQGKPHYTAFAEYGRYNTSREGGSASGEVGNTSYSFSASAGHTNGFSSFDKALGGKEKDGAETQTYSGNVASRLTPDFTLKMNGRYNRVDAAYDLFGTDDPVPEDDDRVINGRVAGELKLMGGKWTQELGVNALDTNRSVNESIYGYNHYWGYRDGIDWVHHIRLADQNTLTVGTEAWKEWYKSLTTRSVSVTNKGIFAEDQYNVTDAFFISGSARIDNHQTFGNHATWQIAPGYRIAATGTTLKASYGTGFKAPSLYQLFDPFSGNAALKPEKSQGYDAGFEQLLWGDKVTFGSTAFRNDIRDLIGFGPPPFYPTLNIGRAMTEGVESSVKWRPSLAWTWNATHTYTLAEDLASHQALVRRPKQQATLSATYQHDCDWDVSATARYVGTREDYDINGNRLTMSPFGTLDLAADYTLTPHVTLYGRVNNLLNRHYEEINTYGTSGMALYAGVKTGF